MSCPYLKKSDSYYHNEQFYCKLQNEYVDYNQYRTYCYSDWGTEYVSCPPYDHENTRSISEKPLGFLQTIGILIGSMMISAISLFMIKSVLQKK